MSEGQWSRLANTTVTYAGGTPDRSKEAYFGGSIPWVKSTEVNLGKIFATEETLSELGFASSAAKWIPANTVLVALYGATAAQVGFLTFRATANQAVLAVVANNDLDSTFLFYALTEAKERLLFLAQGSGQPNLNKQIVDNLRLRIPPLAQQRKIARILTTLDSLIEKTESLIAKYQSIKQGMMADLFTRGVDANGKLRPPQSAAPELYKQSELGWIPKEWEVERFGDACEKVSVGIATSTTEHFRERGVPLLRNQNIHATGIETDDILFISPQFDEINRSKRIRENDILTMRTGYPGKSALVSPEMDGWQTFTTLISHPIESKYRPDFMVRQINSDLCMTQIQALQGGGAQQNLNVGWFVTLLVMRPSLTEQQTIVTRLSEIGANIRRNELLRKKYSELKNGLMQDLLTGKVPVKPDEYEEAA